MPPFDTNAPVAPAVPAVTVQNPSSHEVPQAIVGSDELIDTLDTTILATACFRLRRPVQSDTPTIRALCDSGSQLNLITKECAARLDMWIDKTKATIIGAGLGSQITAAGQMDAQLEHRLHPTILGPARFMIVHKICGPLPQSRINADVSDYIQDEDLSDPNWRSPAKIDALIGAGTLSMIMLDGLTWFEALIAQKTKLGWMISGRYPSERQIATFGCNQITETTTLDEQIQRLWDLPEEPLETLTSLEQLVENHFAQTHQRDPTGRYIVSIAAKPKVPPLGRSRHIAMKRFIAFETKMLRDPAVAEKCQRFMQSYLDEGHMVLAPPAPADPSLSYCIPYHAIQSSKFRIVFDGSCSTSSGISLNDHQLPGPKLQHELAEQLLSFRLNRFALTADIVQMFRQVKVSDSQWNYQRILWRSHHLQPVREYMITCVVWGCSSATFSAVRSLQQCARDHADEYPEAAEQVLTRFYVDDLLTGADSYVRLASLRKQIEELLKCGGFPIAKWLTNHPQLAMVFGQNSEQEMAFGSEPGILGMTWVPCTDQLKLRLNDYPTVFTDKPTKRHLISRIAQVYDPTGLFAPITVVGKIIMQDIWRLKIKWDDLVPDDIITRWKRFHESILRLGEIEIPRWTGSSPHTKVSFHVFSDASEVAYGACIYMRVITEGGQIKCNLLASRNRVAPIKKQTIPRLELLGAVVAVHLHKYVANACQLLEAPVHFWTDSTIVLHWINKDVDSLKTFVANRVTKIQTRSMNADWRHVAGVENPADLLSRGHPAPIIRSTHLVAWSRLAGRL